MPLRTGRLDRWSRRHPLIVLAVGVAVLGWMVFWEIERIAAARHTVAYGWTTGLAAGVTASLALAALLIAVLRMNKRTPGKGLGAVAVAVLTLVITVSVVFAFLATAPPTVNVKGVPYIVTTGIAVAGMAYAATFAAMCLSLTAWAAIRVVRIRLAGGQAGGHVKVSEGAHRDLLTGLIGPCRSGWDVSWIGDGRLPRRLVAATLTEAADEAAAAAVALYLRRPAGAAAAANFQIALFPYRYTKGPIFEITGGPGMFTAAENESGRVLRGATLEDLVAAAGSAGDLRPGEYMFHWIRPVTALSPLPPPAGSQPGAASGSA